MVREAKAEEIYWKLYTSPAEAGVARGVSSSLEPCPATLGVGVGERRRHAHLAELYVYDCIVRLPR